MAEWKRAPVEDWKNAPEVAPESSPPKTTSEAVRGMVSHLGRGTSPKDQLKAIDDTARSVASGMSFGLADEFAAYMDKITGRGGSYRENLKRERERDAQIPPAQKLVGELIGAGTTGAGLARKGLTLMNPANPTIKALAGRGALEGTAYGAAHGFGAGRGGVENRLRSAATGGALGGVAGGALGAVGGTAARKAGKQAVPTTKELKVSAGEAYKAAERAGVVVRPDAFSNFVGGLQARLTRKGIDPTLHPKVTQAMKRMTDTTGPVSLEQIDILRRVARSAAKSTEPDERRLATTVIDALDDFIGGLKPSSVAAGAAPKAVAALKKARRLWSRYRKADEIETLIERAGLTAGNFTGSGFENALRTEFRNLAKNPKRMRRFTKPEQAAIKKVAKGGPVQNVFRAIGRFAPRGVVSSGFHVGVGAAADPMVGFATMLGAQGARHAATAATKRNAYRALDLMAAGRAPVPRMTPETAGIMPPAIATFGQQAGATDQEQDNAIWRAIMGR